MDQGESFDGPKTANSKRVRVDISDDNDDGQGQNIAQHCKAPATILNTSKCDCLTFSCKSRIVKLKHMWPNAKDIVVNRSSLS